MDVETNRFRRFVDNGMERLLLPHGRANMPLPMRLLRRIMRYVYFMLGAILLKARMKPGDLVLACDTWSFFLASLAVPFDRIVYYEIEVLGHQDRNTPFFERWLRGFMQRNVRKCALLVSVERHRLRFLSKFYRQPNTELVLNAPMRADVKRLAADRPLGKRPRILYAGRLWKYTLAPLLLDFVKKYHHLYEIEIFGLPDDDCKAAFEDIRHLDGVTCHGFAPREDLERAFERANVSVVMWDPTDRSNFGLKYCAPCKFFDAAAMGIPVVCSPNPPIKEWLAEYRVGEVIEPLDADELNDAVAKITAPESYAKYREECLKSSDAWIYDEQVRPVIERVKAMPQFQTPSENSEAK
ncbi:glycosyltransferase [Kordiimonas marina]|uniref:glycosyltransferase n=1 Tax=Kordiimonas marina TaxID=2872312 RepID=UPI001FF2C852|nr:glycosyltransferase [Kordiimonas marina]MCJ9429976.1 glycosyltransferase [Kordiimonas marina]